ncbi:MAG: hypothetical protein PVI75_08090 [Gammaproteobacteria bacterium]
MNFYLGRFPDSKTMSPTSIEKTLSMRLTKVDAKFTLLWRCIENKKIVQKAIKKLKIQTIIDAKQSYNKILNNKSYNKIRTLVENRLKTIQKLEKSFFNQKFLEIKKDCKELLERARDYDASIKLKKECLRFLEKVNLTNYKDIKLNIQNIIKEINKAIPSFLRSELNKINKKYDLVMKYYNISNNDMDSFVVLPYDFLQENREENPEQLIKKQVSENAPSVRKEYEKFLKKIKGAGFKVMEMECNLRIKKLDQIIKNCKNNQKICNIL